MSLRNTTNPGKRERVARKRRRRVWKVERNRNFSITANHAYFLHYPEAESVPLQLGQKHYGRWIRRSLVCVR